MDVAVLMDALGNDLRALSAVPALNRNLQIEWILSLQELIQGDDLTPTVAASVQKALMDTQKWAKKHRNKGTDIEKAHYRYALALFKTENN